MPKVGMAEIRRPQLINATMQVIDQVGLQGASVALIGRAASVSPGIINHYFGGKDGLLEATMRSVLFDLSSGVRKQLSAAPEDDVVARLTAIIRANFDPSQTSPQTAKTWLAFWAQAMHHPELFRLQRVNEKRLLSYLRFELKKVLPKDQAIAVSLSLAALIDGFWLRGALSPGGVNEALATELILDYLRQQLPSNCFVKP
ncbi:transcriptional regulator BetI [Neptunomonas sp.]|uniref:transcriptional regulator BetI n=1 Tax=Neptunomonas TaxID=75687 RepID=UPI0035183A4D